MNESHQRTPAPFGRRVSGPYAFGNAIVAAFFAWAAAATTGWPRWAFAILAVLTALQAGWAAVLLVQRSAGAQRSRT